ncbi:hypothetical protein ACOACO_11235 [Nocardioides sp. CPCC 205120]|uniref:hypothetical protein n=1 Tax=Nocardioides sp. CPCC 205120 TaxID=3406462 RepID=UPI003B50B540
MSLDAYLASPLLDDRFPLPLDAPFGLDAVRAEGFPVRWLGRLVRSGHLRRVVRGVYVAAQVPDSTRLRIDSLALVVPDDAVVCDRHAGWLHGAGMVLAPNEHLELQPIRVFRPSGRERLRNGLADSGERAFAPGDLVDLGGLRVTTPLRTTWDLGRVRSREHALGGLDAMLRLGVFTQDELLDGVDRFRKQRWVRTLRELAPLADGRSESPGESVTRLRWLDLGIGTPEPQLELRRGGLLVARLDLAERSVRFAVEYDGAEWHTSPGQRAHDRARREMVVEEFGYLVEAVRAGNVFGAQRDVEGIIFRGMEEARRRLGRVA